MSRQSLTLRKPSNPSPEAIAAFIGADDEGVSTKPASEITTPPPLRALSSTSMNAPSFRRASRAIVQRRTRPARRRTTIYLEVDVAEHLAAVLVRRDQELSDAVNAAVRSWLQNT